MKKLLLMTLIACGAGREELAQPLNANCETTDWCVEECRAICGGEPIPGAACIRNDSCVCAPQAYRCEG